MVPNFKNLTTELQLDFEQLTMIEEMFIAPIQPIMSVFRLPSGGLVHRGYCASFSQDIQPVCDQLPRLAEDVSLLIVKKKTKLNLLKEFIVNRKRIESVLYYLCKNNSAYINLIIRFYLNIACILIQFIYKGIKINTCQLNRLPEYGAR